jgi:hypothetical protein
LYNTLFRKHTICLSAILRFANRRSRILYAWEHVGVPVDEVVNDILRAFHHPAIRDERIDIQRDMFKTVSMWVNEYPRRHELNQLLNSEAVKHGKNHIVAGTKQKNRGGGHSHTLSGGGGDWMSAISGLGHGKTAGSLWSQVQTRDMDAMTGGDGNPANNYLSTSPAPGSAPFQPPGSPGYGYHHGAPPSEGYNQNQNPPPGGYGYGGGPPQPSGYASGYYDQGPPQQGGNWNQGPPQQQYGGGPPQQQYPPQQYQQYPPQYPPQGPPPGQGWGGGGYGGGGY